MRGTTEVKKIVYGGWGLAHFEGKTLFLPYTAPGDEVEFSVVHEKKNCLFGRVDALVKPSPSRIEPACPVFGTCGGCNFLHLGYEDELEVKKNTVLESLERIGRIKIELKSVIPSPSRFGYRNTCDFKTDEQRRPGFTKRESSDLVPFPPEGCLLLPPEIRKSIADLPGEALPATSEIRARRDRYGTVHFWGLADRVGPPDTLMETGGLLFPVSPTSFFQVNDKLNDRLVRLVVSLPSKVRRRLLDLYCGVGFFTLALSRIVMEATGIELELPAHRNAQAAARLNKISNVTFKRGKAESLVYKQRDFDMLIADPPRAGMPKSALRGIIRLRPKELLLVYCEPPSFARDAARLIEAGYIVREIHLIDLFPGTYHVETVAHFLRS